MLDLRFAYATNGQEIVEFDFLTGLERTRTDYPTPGDLWARYRAATRLSDPQVDQLLAPFNHVVDKGERYYQQIAVNRVVEAILTGRRRLLVTMATGTGKTPVAFQICWKLWTGRWNRTGEHRRPRILYLADRNILIDQPKEGIFAEFGTGRDSPDSVWQVRSRHTPDTVEQIRDGVSDFPRRDSRHSVSAALAPLHPAGRQDAIARSPGLLSHRGPAEEDLAGDCDGNSIPIIAPSFRTTPDRG